MELGGESLHLLADRGVWLPRRGVLAVSDPHFGKGAAFRAAGVAIPMGTTPRDLGRLDRLLLHSGARRLVILGDFFHSPGSRTPEVTGMLRDWRDRHPRLEVVLVRGNHDRWAGDPPQELGVRVRSEGLVEDGLRLVHDPGEAEWWDDPGPEPGTPLTLAGHLHPVVTLVRRGGRGVRLPCFWVRPGGIVLPAFGSFTGGQRVAPRLGDRIVVVADGQVTEISVPE